MSELALQLIAKEQQEKTGRLDLGNCGLTSIPEELFELIWLEELSFCNRIWDYAKNSWDESSNIGSSNRIDIEEFPEGFKNLNKLTKFHFSAELLRNSGAFLDCNMLSNFRKIKTLYLRNNQIKEISFISSLLELEYLDLSSNSIYDISYLEKLTELQTLDISANGQYYNISPLKNLVQLHFLNLSDNNISEIKYLENLTGLRVLNLGNNKVVRYNAIGNLTKLKFLDLGGNYCNDYSFLSNLKELESLTLYDNNMKFTNFFEHLSGLKHLDINSNQISDTSHFYKLTGIQSINLQSNQISDISFIEKLPRLHSLRISFNRLKDIKLVEIHNGLRSLTIGYNQIQNIDFLGKLPKLQSLNLSNAQIIDCKSLRDVKELQSLNLSGNFQITDISFLENLTKLSSLDLSINKISDISVLKNLTNLQSLVLSDNKISDISPLLSLLKKGLSLPTVNWGKGIIIGKNPLTDSQMAVVRQGRQAVINYLEEIENERTFPLREAKLLIMGAKDVGKTSFIIKLNNANANLPKEKDETVGITVNQSPKKYVIDGKEYILNIWDFGGQDIYHPTHQFFLTKNSIYVLMVDDREQNTDFYYWLQTQELLAADSPLFIIQNIKNNNLCSIPLTELKAKFDNIKDYFELDLDQVTKESKIFEKIVAIIKATLQGLPHIGEPFPERRLAIRNDLNSLKERNYIKYSEYLEICESHNYTDPQRQKELVQQLHDLGTILHFQNTPALEEIVITNPQWTIDAVYEILSHTKEHYKNIGHFTWNNLKEVWTNEKYNGVYFEILTLMEKFELCFELPNKKYTYIAPLLLSTNKPKYSWNDKGNLQIIYQYDFMPKGIMARLIVRLHTHIKENIFWKHGMILEYNKTQAQIIEDYNERKISISVEGEYAKELIFTIYSSIDEINSSYHFSNRNRAVKLVPCNCSECLKKPIPNFYDFEELQERIQKKKETIECKFSYKHVVVKSLLDYITPIKTMKDSPVKLFISYAHEDIEYKKKLEIAFAVQKRNNKVKIWSDQEILAGSNGDNEIEIQLKQANIIVLLLSPDFFNSDYIRNKELPIVNQRHEQKTVKVIPILLRECDWEDTVYRKIQVVPINPKTNNLTPISKWSDKDTAWKIVVNRIKKYL